MPSRARPRYDVVAIKQLGAAGNIMSITAVVLPLIFKKKLNFYINFILFICFLSAFFLFVLNSSRFVYCR